jgi:hypothetical protein
LTAPCHQVPNNHSGKIRAEVFSTAKKFVLVCVTDSAAQFFLFLAAALRKAGAFRSNVSSFVVKRQF